MTATLEQLTEWLTSDRSTAKPDLSRADLSGANLSRANLSRANLSGADLSGANLSGASLSRADLSGADLSRANLSGANLSGANLSGANLSGADLSGANLSRADLSGADLSRTRLNACIGNNKEIITLQLTPYIVTIYGGVIAIGCQQRTVAEWEAITDSNLNKLDPGAISWKHTNIDIIRRVVSAQVSQ